MVVVEAGLAEKAYLINFHADLILIIIYNYIYLKKWNLQ